MTVGEQKTLPVTIYPSNAQTNISWKTSDSEIASVSSNGTLTALKHGFVRITATTDNGLSANCDVAVNKSRLSLFTSHNSGLIQKNTSIQLTASNSDASIYYTTNGSAPSASSVKYVGPINISKNTKLKAIAVHPDYLDSDVIELEFEITSLCLLNTMPEQGIRNSAPHLLPCLIFNSSIKKDAEFDNIKALSNGETVPIETVIDGEELYVVPQCHIDNCFISVEIPERAIANYSNEYNTLIAADFDYATTSINLVDCWTNSSRLMDNGDLYVWGYKEEFPKSFGVGDYQETPSKALTGVKKYYDAGYGGSGYYITDDDVLMGWGANYNDNLQSNPDNSILGDGTVLHRESAVKIAENVSRIEKNGWTNGLIKNDGTLWLWGQNRFGQIGNGQIGTSKFALSPEKILSNVKDFSLGTWHSLALKIDGSVWAWGLGSAIGRGSNASTPVKIIDSGVVEIEAGSCHNIILKENGDVYCFGENDDGQIGTGYTSWYEAPYKVMSDAIHIYAGYGGCYALKSNGDLYRWGMVAHRPSTSVYSPELISSDVNEVHVTDDNVIVRMNDNSVWCMGSNHDGLLGLGYSEVNVCTSTFSKVFEDVESVWPVGSKIFVKKLDGSYWGIGLAIGIATDSSDRLVVKPVEVLNIPIKDVISISLPEILVIEIGNKGIVLPDITPTDANYEKVSWTSFDSNIASVNENGIIHGRSIGETVVEATISDYANSYRSSCIVKIVEIGAGLDAIISNLEEECITVYDMKGIVVYKGDSCSIPKLSRGIYIISAKNKIIKFLKQ